ncbi:MAG: hypothetical protein ACO3X1_15805 [Burkholderiaceae bacterium]
MLHGEAQLGNDLFKRDALAASQQALDSELGRLQTERNALQEQRDALQTVRDELQTERDNLTGRLLTLTSQFQELDGQRQELCGQLEAISAQHDELQQERDGLRGEHDQLMEAFLHVFPHANYRNQRPDLASMSDQKIAMHFAHHGIREGVSLNEKLIASTQKSLQEANQALQAKQHELEALIADYNSRLSSLQDLFVKLSLEGRKR